MKAIKEVTRRKKSIPAIPIRRDAAEAMQYHPLSGSGPLHIAQARRKPVETVCRLFDYGMDGSLITVWEEWIALAITSSEENEYSEGSGRARLLRFSGYFTQLIAAWMQLYIRITPEALRPPLELPRRVALRPLASIYAEPEAAIAAFCRLYTRAESMQELWSVVEAVAGNPAARQVIRTNLLSYYETTACIAEAGYSLFLSPKNRAGKGL